MNSNGDERSINWKLAAYLMAGGAIGGVGEKIVSIDRSDVSAMIVDAVSNGPYARDRGSIEVRLQSLERAQAAVSQDIAGVVRSMTRLETKIDVLLQR